MTQFAPRNICKNQTLRFLYILRNYLEHELKDEFNSIIFVQIRGVSEVQMKHIGINRNIYIEWVISIYPYDLNLDLNRNIFKTESFGLIVFSRQYNKVTSNQYLHTTLIISEASICRKSVSLKCLSAVKKTATSAH